MKNGYGEISADLRADLWIYHMQRYLLTHPTLSAEERALVLEGIGMVAAGLIDFGSKPEATKQTRAILDGFAERSRAIMPADHFAEAFVSLGREALPAHTGEHKRSTLMPSRIVPLCVSCTPDCECATASDWCNGITNPDNVCTAGSCITIFQSCGTFWQYDCYGICKPPRFPR